MNIPNKISIFKEDFKKEDHIVMYGVRQDECVLGLIHFLRKDTLLKRIKKMREGTMQKSSESSDFIDGEIAAYNIVIALIDEIVS